MMDWLCHLFPLRSIQSTDELKIPPGEQLTRLVIFVYSLIAPGLSKYHNPQDSQSIRNLNIKKLYDLVNPIWRLRWCFNFQFTRNSLIYVYWLRTWYGNVADGGSNDHRWREIEVWICLTFPGRRQYSLTVVHGDWIMSLLWFSTNCHFWVNWCHNYESWSIPRKRIRFVIFFSFEDSRRNASYYEGFVNF